MRYDTPIYFQSVKSGAYNADTGDYEPDTVSETCRYASVMDTGTETLRLIYGEIRQGSKTVHLLTPYTDPFSRIRIGRKIYRADHRQDFRTKQAFVVSEVQ